MNKKNIVLRRGCRLSVFSPARAAAAVRWSTCSRQPSDKSRYAFNGFQLVRQKEDSVRLYEKQKKRARGVT